MTLAINAPQPLSEAHDTSGFDCGEAVLNHWLQRKALTNHLSGASRVFVVTQKNSQQKVLGCYALSAGAVAHAEASGTIRRNMPDPIPVMVLGRLAVDLSGHGHGLGSALLKDAILRTLHVAENVGIRALLVHALDDKARAFYLRYGFVDSPVSPLTLMLRLPRVASGN